MINKNNGHIEVPGFNTTLFIGMPLEDLERTSFYQHNFKKKNDMNTGYCWYVFKEFEVLENAITLNLCFFEGCLKYIHFYTYQDGDSTSWDNWNEEAEINLFHRNNQFLSKVLNEPVKVEKKPYPRCVFLFAWGNVWSVYDPRGAQASMGIQLKSATTKID